MKRWAQASPIQVLRSRESLTKIQIVLVIHNMNSLFIKQLLLPELFNAFSIHGFIQFSQPYQLSIIFIHIVQMNNVAQRYQVIFLKTQWEQNQDRIRQVCLILVPVTLKLFYSITSRTCKYNCSYSRNFLSLSYSLVQIQFFHSYHDFQEIC